MYDYSEDLEQLIERKSVRATSRHLKEKRKNKEINKLKIWTYGVSGFPSLKGNEWDDDAFQFVGDVWVKRPKNSYAKQFYKKYTSKIVRKTKYDTLKQKGKGYRRVFDYYMTLI